MKRSLDQSLLWALDVVCVFSALTQFTYQKLKLGTGEHVMFYAEIELEMVLCSIQGDTHDFTTTKHQKKKTQ